MFMHDMSYVCSGELESAAKEIMTPSNYGRSRDVAKSGCAP